MSTDSERWRRCSTCKGDIDFDTEYFTCSVSTCNRPRTGLVFCSVTCWDAHVPIMRHRDDVGALDARSPTAAEARAQAQAANPAAPKPVAPSAPARTPAPGARKPEVPREILIVVSKLKSYIRARADFNTADGCADVLSDQVRALCDRAIENARRDERKTVLERDFKKA